MKLLQEKSKFLLAGIAAAIAILGITGCPGSSSGGGSPAAPAGVPGFARGVITAKGSVFVNGIEYDTSAASITLDNLTGADDALAIGMNVDIKGHIDTATGLGTADEIAYASSIYGTIDAGSIDAVAGTFDVFGQAISTDLTTVYDGSTGLSGTSPLAAGDRVEISGVTSGTSILASRVEKKNGSTDDFKLRGTVSSLSGSSFDLTLEGGTVFAITFTGTLDAGIANGSTVKIETSSAPTGLSLTVAAGKIEAAHELSGDNGDRLEVEGIVSGFTAGSPATFTVDGIDVSASSSLAAGVSNGLEVHAEGTLSGGVLVATSIDVAETVDLELKGVVTTPNTAAGTFKLNGATVYTGPETIFVDDSDTPVALFGLDDLTAGNTAEVKGFIDSDSHLFAAKIERHTGETEAELQGVVSAKTATSVTVYGIVIDLDSIFVGDTEARDSFLAGVTAGSTRVKLVGTVSGVAVTWTSIELDS